MDLGNILINCLSCLGEFLMVSTYYVWLYIEQDLYWIMKLSIVMIHQVTILHGLSTLKGYWVNAKVNKRLWHMGETLRWLNILMDRVIVDGGW